MNKLKMVSILMVFGFLMTFGSEVGELLSLPGTQNLVPSVEARVGRPLTPVSVAGVARRTVRRCAVGVYCQLSAPQPFDKQVAQDSTGSASPEYLNQQPIIALRM